MPVAYLELQLHAGDRLAGVELGEFLYVRVQVARRDLRVAARHGLQQRVVDEDILVLRLHHVVALRTQTRHMAVNVNGLLMFDAL